MNPNDPVDDTTKDPIRLIGLHCRHATRLISQSMDRPLRRGERIALGLHLFVCKWCRRYQWQLRMIQRTIREFASTESTGSNVRLPDAARQRLKKAIRRGS